MRLGVALLVLALCACTSAGPRLGWTLPTDEVMPAPAGLAAALRPVALPQPDGLPRTALHDEVLNGRRFPYPLVRANLRGHATWLIVDTGASHIVLARWLVEAVGLEVEPSGQRGEGHAGEEVETYLVRDPQLHIESWGQLGLDELLVVDLPDVFAQLHLGGVLSPQALAPDGHSVVLDLPGRELRLVPEEWRLGEDGGARLVTDHATVCVVDGHSRGAVFLVDALVEGRPARMVVDTGAARSDVMMQSSAARALLHRSLRGESSYTAGGRVDSRRVPHTQLVVGELARKLDLSIMPGSDVGTCARDGHLGLDMLSRCVMMLSPERFDARCGQ